MKGKRYNVSRNEDSLWRNKAHMAFDKLWKNGSFLSRYAAYIWLAEKMSMSIEMCHFKYFTVEQCKKAISIVKAYKN